MTRSGQASPEPPLRVLHLLAERGWSGGEVQLDLLVRHLAERGYVQHCALVPGARFAEAAHGAGVAVTAIDLRRPWWPSVAWRLRRLVKEFAPQVVHFGCGRSLRFGGWFLLGLRGAAKVTTRRIDYPIGRGPRAWRYRWLVDHVVANSRGVEQVVLAAGVPPARVSRIHEGIPLAPWQGARAERDTARLQLGIPAPAFVICCAATLRPRKGQRQLVEAVARLAAEYPQLLLVLAGEGPDRAALQQLARERGIEAQVRVPGAVRPIRPLYAASDLFVLVSHHEGLSNACLEASAAGLPLVVSRAGGLPEIVDDGVTGLVVDAGDVDGIAAAIGRMLREPEFCARAGAAGAARTAELFAAERMTANMEALFQRLGRGCLS